MEFLVGGDSLLELLLAYITPRADSVADDLNLELRHSAAVWARTCNWEKKGKD